MDERVGNAPGGEVSARLGAAGRIALCFFAAAAAYFLWTEHRAHVAQALPWLVLALCPLMHAFMHRGHAGHDGPAHGGPQREGRDA